MVNVMVEREARPGRGRDQGEGETGERARPGTGRDRGEGTSPGTGETEHFKHRGEVKTGEGYSNIVSDLNIIFRF